MAATSFADPSATSEIYSGLKLEIPSPEYRVIPIPSGLPGTVSKAKLATCFVRVGDLPTILEDWMDVNPRVPRKSKRGQLTGAVAKAIVGTLENEPDKFAFKNTGIFILADRSTHNRGKGGIGTLTLTLSDPELHGLVNGGHTFLAIRQFIEGLGEDDEPIDAFVRLHIYEGVSAADIAEIAEGLNRSMQVSDPSLENLQGSFDRLKDVMKGKPGEDQISYHQGHPGDVDVLQVLQIMCLFDLKEYADRKVHPNGLFGQTKKVLSRFLADQDDPEPVFDKILPFVPDFLRLSDEIQKQLSPFIGKWKISERKTGNRAGSAGAKNRSAYFAGGNITNLVPLGLLYPALGAFRANVNRSAWEGGNLEWLTDPFDLLEEVVGEFADILYEEKKENNHKPAEVGRKEAAYRGCYGVVTMALAEKGLLG